MKKIEKKIKMTEKHREAWFNAIRNNDIETVQRMLEDGFDVNCRNNNIWIALHIACYFNQNGIAKLLIDSGADINAQNNTLSTPLHISCIWENIEIVKLLINNDADVAMTDTYGDTPIGYLKKNNPQKYEELIEWLSEHHPGKMLEYIAHEKTQCKGVGL